jgi:archaeoflavoprotein AfpA
MNRKFVWGITGTGYLLEESIDLMKELKEEKEIKITVMLSKEGAVVVKWYKQWDYLNQVIDKVKVEKTPNNPFLAGPLQIGTYDFLLVCPVSANTMAKIAYGIADTLISNCVAQTIKGGVPVYLLPSDQHKEPIVTSKPDGTELILKIRDIEIANVQKVKNLEGIKVLSQFSDVKELIMQKYQEVEK